jgi:parvulin-like peptidyl-prolyl isomerase
MTIRINGQVIPAAAVEHELGRLIQFYAKHMSETEVRRQMPELQEKAREQAVGAKLLLDQASKMDLPVAEDEVEKQLLEMIEKVGGKEAFAAQVKSQNLTPDAVRQGIIQGRKVDLLIAKLTDGLSDPTEEEIKDHFDTHPEEYTRPDRSAAQHILIKPASASAQDQATARSQLESIRGQIQQGSSFEDLALAHSECPSGKETGGSLGWFTQGMMVPEFDEVVFRMRIGELSQVVDTELGSHLIRKTGHEDGGKLDFQEARENIRDFLRHSARGLIISDHVKDLKDKATIEITED